MSLPGIVGAVAGFFIGGPRGAMYGYQIGSMAGALLDPPKGPHIEGPRLNDLSVQTSTYGATIPRGYGTFPVVGNIFWLENNALKEVATTTTSSSGGKGGGGSESTTTTYSYYATFAVGLCEGPIIGVRRIWIGPKLIYDAGATELSQLSASAEASSLFTVHPGTDTQLADDRMQATLGVADTPAYRGLAYIVLKDYPLAAHGNSLMGAQVKVEVVKGGAITPIVFASAGVPALGAAVGVFDCQQIDPHGYCWRRSADDTKLLRIHVPTGTVTCIRSSSSGSGDILSLGGFDSIGTLLCYAPFAGPDLVTIAPTGAETTGAIGALFAGFGASPGIWVEGGTSTLGIHYSDGSFAYGNAPDGNYTAITAGNVQGRWIYWMHYQEPNYDSMEILGRFDPVLNFWEELFSLPVGYTAEGTGGMSRIVAGGDGYFYVYAYGSAGTDRIEKYDAAGTLIASGPMGTGVPVMYHQDGKLVTYNASDSRWYVIDVETMTSLGYGTHTPTQGIFYDAFNISTMMVDETTVVVLDTVPAGTELLSAIVSAECLASNLLTAGDIDVTALTQAVRGYRVSSVSAIRSALEPLQGCWPFDVVQHGYQIKFVPRGGVSIATVPAADLDARAAGAAPGIAITNVREMDSMLPARVSLKFLDVAREYDIGEQYAERLNTAAVNIRSIDVAIVLDADEAAAIAERLLYLYWLERYDVSFNLPSSYNQAEPADILTIEADEGSYTLRLAAITYTPDGRLECQSKYHSAATYLPTAVGEAGQSTGGTVAYIGDATYELLDIPLLLDAFDHAGFPAAMAGYTDSWPGGVLYTTSDEGQTWTPLQGFTAPGGVIGLASTAIGAGRTDLVDKSSELSISLRSGTLSSVTEAAMLNGANHFAYGVHGRWEIIAAQNCTLQGDGTYILTDLLRGRFGTEWAAGLHGATDTLVLLDSAALAFIATSVNTIGTARTYRGITSGKAFSSAPDIVFIYAGVNLECLSPVYLNGNRHPSTNDWTLDWVRRTRVGGEWRDYVDAPLSETSQSYEIEIYSNGTYTTLKRTLTASTPTVAYTSEQQVTDFESNQATLYVKVYQLSANVGRGYPLATSITR